MKLPILSSLLLSLSACVSGTDAPEPRTPVPITVASILPLSGTGAFIGVKQRNGMELALEDINATGGINGRPLRIDFADSQLDRSQGLKAYERFASNPEIVGVVGITGSDMALFVGPLAEKDQLPILSSINTSPALTDEGGGYFFRNIASDADGGQILTDWAMKREHETAAIIYNFDVEWSSSCRSMIEDAYTAVGGTLVLEPVAVSGAITDFRSAAITVKIAKPDAVFVCLMGRQAGLFTSQALANNLHKPFYGTESMTQQEYIDQAGRALTMSWFALPASAESAAYAAFAERYKGKHSSEVDSIAAKAYDALQVMAVALRSAQGHGALDGPSVREALTTTTYHGITGENSFDAKGDLRHPKFKFYTYTTAGERTDVPW